MIRKYHKNYSNIVVTIIIIIIVIIIIIIIINTRLSPGSSQ